MVVKNEAVAVCGVPSWGVMIYLHMKINKMMLIIRPFTNREGFFFTKNPNR